MKDIRLEIKIKSNILLKLREQAGLGLISMAKHIGISYMTYQKYEYMLASPYSKKYKKELIKPTAEKILSYYGMELSQIWTKGVLTTIEASKVVGMIEIDSEIGLPASPRVYLPTPDEVMNKKEVEEAVQKALGVLTSREGRTIRRRFGIGGRKESTLEESAGELGVTRERVRQIEDKAIRKLRHPKTSNKLLQFVT